jgi:hypothetical protein
MLSAIYAEFHLCRVPFMLNVIMLIAIMLNVARLNVVRLNVMLSVIYADFRYAECRYPVCRGAILTYNLLMLKPPRKSSHLRFQRSRSNTARFSHPDKSCPGTNVIKLLTASITSQSA